MNKPYTYIKDWGHHCGYGVFLDKLHGKKRIYHHGGIKGFMRHDFPKKIYLSVFWEILKNLIVIRWLPI